MSGIQDERRKLSEQDYARIQFQFATGYTIRSIAGEHNVSTKYIRKILTGSTDTVDDMAYAIYSHNCSGCGRNFTFSGIMEHFEWWTSGGNQLSCMTVMAGFR